LSLPDTWTSRAKTTSTFSPRPNGFRSTPTPEGSDAATFYGWKQKFGGMEVAEAHAGEQGTTLRLFLADAQAEKLMVDRGKYSRACER